jgi:hypothetical protein
MDSYFIVKLILENQRDQRKIQSMMEMRMTQQEELNRTHSEQIVQMVTQHHRTMENFVNASLTFTKLPAYRHRPLYSHLLVKLPCNSCLLLTWVNHLKSMSCLTVQRLVHNG